MGIKHRAVRVALAAIILLAAAGYAVQAAYYAVAAPPIAVMETVGGSVVRMEAGRSSVWRLSGACVPLTWVTQNARRVYIEGERVEPAGAVEWCIHHAAQTSVQLGTNPGENYWRVYSLNITRAPFSLLRAALALAAAGWFARWLWTAPRLLPENPLRGAPTRADWVKYTAPVVVPLGLFLGAAYYSLDFGNSYDEGAHMFEMRQALFLGHPTPEYYTYPSTLFWLKTAALAPDVPRLLNGEVGAVIRDLDAYHLQLSNDHVLRTRALLVTLSGLAIFWVYLLVLVWQRSVWAALLAASVLAFSWEFLWRARIIGPDGIMAATSAMTLALALLSLKHPRRAWLYWAAALSAGLCFSTKWNAGFIGMPVGLVAVLAAPGYLPWVGRWFSQSNTHDMSITRWQYYRRILLLPLVFFAVPIALTPGIFYDFEMVWYWITYEIDHYGRRGHPLYDVAAGWPHFVRNLEYLLVAMPSPYRLIGAALGVLALIGVVYAARKDWRATLVILSLPLLFVPYMSSQVIMFVRNLLLVVPVVAVFAGVGGLALVTWLRPLRYPLAGVLAALVIVNAGWMLYAAEETRNRRDSHDIAPLVAEMIDNPDLDYWLSPMVLAEIRKQGFPVPGNAVFGDVGAADRAAMYWLDEHTGLWRSTVLLNRPWMLRWYGPYDVNINYFPDNNSPDNRVLVMDADLLLRSRILRFMTPEARQAHEENGAQILAQGAAP